MTYLLLVRDFQAVVDGFLVCSFHLHRNNLWYVFARKQKDSKTFWDIVIIHILVCDDIHNTSSTPLSQVLQIRYLRSAVIHIGYSFGSLFSG